MMIDNIKVGVFEREEREGLAACAWRWCHPGDSHHQLSPVTSKHNTRTHTHPAPLIAHCSVVELEAPTHPFLYLTHFPVNTVDAGEPSLFPLGWKTLAEWEKEGSGRTGAVEDELKGGGKYQGEWVCPLTPPRGTLQGSEGIGPCICVCVYVFLLTC